MIFFWLRYFVDNVKDKLMRVVDDETAHGLRPSSLPIPEPMAVHA